MSPTERLIVAVMQERRAERRIAVIRAERRAWHCTEEDIGRSSDPADRAGDSPKCRENGPAEVGADPFADLLVPALTDDWCEGCRAWRVEHEDHRERLSAALRDASNARKRRRHWADRVLGEASP